MLLNQGGRCALALLVALVGCGERAGEDDGTSATDSSDGDTASGTETDTLDDDGTGSTSTDDSSTSDTSDSDTTEDETTGGPVGSAGCGIADPPSGDLVIDVDGIEGTYVLSVPADYDPQTPYPLGFAFHGANRTGPQCQQGDCAGFQTAMENDAVLVYMTSVGGPGWTDDIDLEVEFFETVLDHVLANYCIDDSLVYTAGTSSGAHFVNILGCRLGERIAAIAPVAGVLFESECGAPVAALVIHGVDDSSFDGGVEARDFWREHSGCTDVTVPPISEIHEAVVGEPESHGCAEYQGCDPGVPVVWCEHSEGGYDGTTHGWPLFGGDRIWEFVSGL